MRVAGHSPKTPCWDFIPNPVKLKISRPRCREVFRRRVLWALFLLHSSATSGLKQNTATRPTRSAATQSSLALECRAASRTYMETMYRSAPFGFPRLFPRSLHLAPACVETFIISWYNQPKARKEAVVTWQTSKARRGS